MPIEKDIEEFKMWATRMGCPLHCIPTDEALNSLFRSRQSSLMFNMMKMVRPIDEVKNIRMNILVSKLKKFEGKPIESYARAALPKELQRYCEIKETERKTKLMEEKLKEAKKDCDLELLRTMVLQKEKLEHTVENLTVKCNILELRSEDLDKKIEEEEKMKEKILKLMPTKPTLTNMKEEIATKAITNAFIELDEFYNTCVTSSNSLYIEKAKEDLWSKLRTTFADIPNCSLWNVLMRMKDDDLQKIKDLIKMSNDNESKSKYETLSEYDIHLIKAKSTILSLAKEYLEIKKEESRLNSKFTAAYTKFCDEVQLKLTEFGCGDGISEEEEEILSNYIVQYNTYNYNQGQKDYLIKEIERCKKIIEEEKVKIADHEVLLGSLRQMYAEIDSAVKKTQEEISQLGEINEKIQYSKKTLQHLVNEAQVEFNQMNHKTKLNLSGESFLNMSMLTDGTRLSPPGPGLCSTKLDMDITNTTFFGNSTFRSNSTMIANQNNMVCGGIPQYTTELALFNEIPIHKFKTIPKECHLSILHSPLSVQSSEPLSVLQSFPGIFLRPEVAIKNFKAKIEWHKQLKNLNTELKTEIPFPEIDEEKIKTKLFEQEQVVTRLMDEMEETSKACERAIMKSQKYYDFLLKNPLGQYIPSTKLVNNQTFADYESEYNMYYKMIQSSEITD